MNISQIELISILATAQRLEKRGITEIEFCFDCKPYILGRLSDKADSQLSLSTDGSDFELVVWSKGSESEIFTIIFDSANFDGTIDFTLGYMKDWDIKTQEKFY
jgi:hypothetical protein